MRDEYSYILASDSPQNASILATSSAWAGGILGGSRVRSTCELHPLGMMVSILGGEMDSSLWARLTRHAVPPPNHWWWSGDDDAAH